MRVQGSAEHQLHDAFSTGAGLPFVLPPRGEGAHGLLDALNEVDPALADARIARDPTDVEADDPPTR